MKVKQRGFDSSPKDIIVPLVKDSVVEPLYYEATTLQSSSCDCHYSPHYDKPASRAKNTMLAAVTPIMCAA
jgi:hypothetical protein